jgi:hypothetical protein
MIVNVFLFCLIFQEIEVLINFIYLVFLIKLPQTKRDLSNTFIFCYSFISLVTFKT